MKVSGALKRLIKKIHYIKNMNLDATDEQELLSALASKHSGPYNENYHRAWLMHMREPYSRLGLTDEQLKDFKVVQRAQWLEKKAIKKRQEVERKARFNL
jgi:hypothetical protein